MSLKDTTLGQASPRQQEIFWITNAHRTLSKYGLSKATVKLQSHTHNAVFLVTEDNEKFVLRLKWTSLGRTSWEASELQFLRQLREETKLIAPYPVQDLEGKHYSVVVDRRFKFPVEISIALFEFIDGESPTTELVTNQQISSIGQYLGEFHKYSQRYKKSTDYRHDKYTTLHRLSPQFPPPDGIPSFHHPRRGDFLDEQLVIMDAVAQKVKSAMDELDQSDAEFGLIHGDLLLKNILFHENEVRALDFEYCGWGYYLYDLTPILWQLKPQARYAELEQALWDGYSSIRPLTERHRELLETFIAGRQVASMRWIAANQLNPYVAGKVEDILAQQTAELSAFLETGELKRE